MSLSFPNLVDASRDKAVHGTEEARQVFPLVLCNGKYLVEMGDVGFEAVDLNGILFEGAADRRADDIDDAGLGDDVVVHIESVQRAVLGEQRVFLMVIGL